MDVHNSYPCYSTKAGAGCLGYEPNTGIFVWLEAGSNAIKVGESAGCQRPDGYIIIAGMRAHRLAFAAMGVPLKATDVVDHIDRNPANNRWDNLRIATKSNNAFNANTKSNNVSGVTGVSWDASRNRWRASLVLAGKQRSARFKTKEEAVNWRLGMERSHQLPTPAQQNNLN